MCHRTLPIAAALRLLGLTILLTLLSLLGSPVPVARAQSSDGLVGYWPFDEGSGTSSADRSGNGNTATLSTGASFTPESAPVLNNAAALTFRTGGQATATSNGLDQLQQLTIAAWVRQTDDQGTQRYITLGDENAVLRHDGGLHFYVKLNGRLVGERLKTTIPLGAYHHVAGTYDGAMLRVYLDGNLVGSEIVSGTLDSGSGLRFSSSAEPLHGELDDVRIYNRALTPSAIRGLAFNCGAVAELPLAECQALVALYASTNGDQWLYNNNWLRNNTPCSSWSDVICTDDSVSWLSLSFNNLSGTIPPELSNLTHLRSLHLNDNELSGAIPPELGDLTHLQDIGLNNNQLSGAIPPELGNLTNLQFFWLNNNQLSGAIPPELGNLLNLQTLLLENNQLSGAIPSELGNLTHLRDIGLNNNQLSGAIPPELGNLTNLQSFRLDNNQLDSTIPATLCGLPLKFGVDWGYNKLLASAPCLANSDPDWMNTQTVPPTQLQAQVVANQPIQVTWTPITYTADGGYYTVLVGVTASGPYTVAAQTVDKTATGITLASLSPGAYYLRVRTFTPKHGSQQNNLTSEDSAAILVLIGRALTVIQDSTLPIQLNANTGDHNFLTYSLMSLPTHGSVSGALPNVRYTPGAGFTGEDSFTFKVNDGQADSNLATITLHVVATPPVNTPPVAQDDVFTITRNSQATVLAVLTNDQDADGDALLLVVVDPPLNGSAEIVNGQLRYTPAADFVGADHFTYTVSDGKSSTVATVNVTVTAPVGGTTSQAVYLPLVQR